MPSLATAFLILLLTLGPAASAAAQASPEVYVKGMRNPYRWSFDRQTGDIYVGDVGGINEEIDYLPAASARGANLGWNCFSGTAIQTGCTPSAPYFPPTYEYPSGPDVVMGGYRERMKQHVADMRRCAAANDVDYEMLTTKQPLDFALFSFLSRRAGK